MNNWFSDKMPNEVSKEEIDAKKNSFHFWNFEPFTMQEMGYEDVRSKLETYTAEKYELLDDEGKEKMVDEVLAIYRSVNYLPIQYYSEAGVMNEIEKCIAFKAKFDGDTVSCGAGVGTTLCNYLFPNLFDVPSKHDLDKKDAETLYRKFHHDDYLRRAIKFCFSYKNGCPTPTNVMGGLRLVGSAPTNFRPMNAKAVYERFCPKGGTIYDFCCVDDETEFFMGTGWKKISEYQEGDKVLQYNEDGTAELVEPEAYIHYESEDPFYLFDSYYLNTCLTGNHDVVCKVIPKGDCVIPDEITKIKMEELYKINESEKPRYCIPTTFKYGGKVDEDPDFVFLMLLIYGFSNCKYDEKTATLTVRVSDICVEEGSEFEFVDFAMKVDDVSTSIKNGIIEISCDKFRKYFSSYEDGSFYLSSDSWFDLSCKCKKAVGNIIENNEYDFDLLFQNLDILHHGNKRQSDIDTLQFFYNSSGMWNIVPEVKFVDEEDGYEFLRLDGFEGVDSPHYFEKGFEIIHKKEKFCFTVPSHMLVLRRGGKIFVTGNCGFGGRMLGCLSSKNNYRYVGTDPCTETMYHLHELGEYIEMVTGRDDSYELHCCGSEDFIGPENSIDFAFSSPPYFDLEVYSDEETQCFNKYPVLEDWLEGYVRQTIKNIYRMLKPGCVYAVNIADFTVGSSKEVAYVDEWIRISTEEGMPLYDTVYLGVTARAGSKQQASGELKKENILIFKRPL